MAEYSSGSIHFSGLGNGTDFDTMITQLKKLELMPAQKMLKWKNDWQIRLDAFGQVRTKLASFSEFLGTMNNEAAFLAKNATSSNPAVAGLVPSTNAVEGTYNIEVNKLASSSQCTLETGYADKFANINATAGVQKFKYNYKGKDYELNVPQGTTLEGLKNIINNSPGNPGVKASLVTGSKGMVLQLHSMSQGSQASLSIDPSTKVGDYGTAVTAASLSVETKYAPANLVNPTGAPQTFTLNFNGAHSFTIDNSTTLQSLASDINAAGLGLTASLDESVPGKTTLKFTADQAGVGSISLGAGSAIGIYGTSPTKASATLRTTLTPTDDVTGGAAGVFSFNYNGAQYSVDVDAGTTLQGLADKINAENTGVSAKLITQSGVTSLQLQGSAANNEAQISIHADTTLPDFGPAYNWTLRPATPAWASQHGSGGWTMHNGEDAEVRVNGWPATGWMKTSSNSLTDIIDGVTVNLYSEGKTTMTVAMDKEKIKENVISFIDQVNEVRFLMNELTKVDSTKKTYLPEDSKNQYEMQKGSVLTGNYGMQLIISKMKSALMDKGKGFSYENQDPLGFISGDAIASLAHIGIHTDSKSGSPTFGMLVFNQDTNLPIFDNILDKNPEAVAELFASKGKATTDSHDFGVDSIMTGFTKGGEYKVEYEVDASGNITSAIINGKKAKIDNASKQIFLDKYMPGEKENDADGITLNIYNLAPGKHPVEQGVQVSKSSYTDPNARVNTSGDNQSFSYTHNGASTALTVPDGTTIDQLCQMINSVTPGVASTTPGADGYLHLQLIGATVDSGTTVQGLGSASMLKMPEQASTVRVKEGKLATLKTMIDVDFLEPDDGPNDPIKGTISILESQYKSIMENIDKKIVREDERVVKWERVTRLRFARLEATLKKYDSLNSQIESQVKQLGTSK